jgi:hypothetical protein
VFASKIDDDCIGASDLDRHHRRHGKILTINANESGNSARAFAVKILSGLGSPPW